jgi:hypothetical protein
VYDGSMCTNFQEPVAAAATASAPRRKAPWLAYSVALPLALGAGPLAVGGGVLVATRRRSSGASQA